jgi:Protein of unknown function (DUF2806)
MPFDAKVEALDEDWVAHFFKQCDTVSDKEMQTLWARLLSGEATNPGTFSKRTVQFVSTISKKDALLFTTLCQFVCEIVGESIEPIIFNHAHDIYKNQGIIFESLTHLQSIGLVTYSPDSYFGRTELPSETKINYFDKSLNIKFENIQDNALNTGKVLFTTVGLELYSISGAAFNQEFYEYLIHEWSNSSMFSVINSVKQL